MHDEITIYTSKKFARNYHILGWISAVLLAFVVSGYIGTRGEAKEGSLLGYIILTAFFGLLTFSGWFLARKTHRLVTVKGKVLTFVEDGIQARTWSIDLQHVIEIRGHMMEYGPFPARMRGPQLEVKMDEGRWRTLELSYYEQADRDKFLPAITELVQRPNVKLGGGADLERVLKVWFGDKAPTITAPIHY